MKSPRWTIGRIASLVVCLLLTCAAQAYAQTAGTAALTGTVTDPNNALVADVQVTATNEVTGEARTVRSQQNGTYVVALLPPGSYQPEFVKAGFKKSVKAGLRVNVTETTRLDIELELGTMQEQVNVTAEAQLLRTESAALGRVTDRMLVSNLPLVSRNYTQVVTLSPGISASVTNANELGRGSSGESQGSFRAHGAFARDNNFQMNGMQINDLQASGFSSGGVAAGDQNNRRANYGLVDFNREDRFMLSYLYQRPSPNFNAFFDRPLGGWAVAGVTTLQSGLPLTLTGTNAANAFGITNDRAQLAPGCNHASLTTSGPVTGRLNNYFNKGCTARNAAGAPACPVIGADCRATAFGNSGAGIAFGPDQRNFDIAVIKRTPLSRLRENANLEFRTGFFNAFNTPQFANPNTNVSSASFGVISSTSVSPRIIQFALKLNF